MIRNKFLTKLAAKLPDAVRSTVKTQVGKFMKKDFKPLMKDNVKRVNRVTTLTQRSKTALGLSKVPNDGHTQERLRGSAVRDRLMRRILNKKYVS